MTLKFNYAGKKVFPNNFNFGTFFSESEKCRNAPSPEMDFFCQLYDPGIGSINIFQFFSFSSSFSISMPLIYTLNNSLSISIFVSLSPPSLYHSLSITNCLSIIFYYHHLCFPSRFLLLFLFLFLQC